MKFTASQADLSSALKTISRAVSNGRTHKVLAGALLAATADGNLALTGYDLELGITTTITASVETPGSIVVPHRLLSEITSRLDGALTVSVAGDGDRCEIASVSGSYSLSCDAAADYPDLPTPEGATGACMALQGVLPAVLPACSTDESKAILQGVHVVCDGAVCSLAATDGHRLVMRAVDSTTPSMTLTVPARAMALLREPVTVASDEAHVSFTAGDTTITSRILTGTYPNVTQLVPETFDHTATVDRVAFMRALERIAVIADNHNSVVKLSSGKLTAETETSSGAESIDLDGKLPDIAANVHYLLDGVKGFTSQQLQIRVNTSTTPVVLADPDDFVNIYLVMPVQVKS
jgi:DNA polymerase-3 subunit beta